MKIEIGETPETKKARALYANVPKNMQCVTPMPLVLLSARIGKTPNNTLIVGRIYDGYVGLILHFLSMSITLWIYNPITPRENAVGQSLVEFAFVLCFIGIIWLVFANTWMPH